MATLNQVGQLPYWCQMIEWCLSFIPAASRQNVLLSSAVPTSDYNQSSASLSIMARAYRITMRWLGDLHCDAFGNFSHFICLCFGSYCG